MRAHGPDSGDNLVDAVGRAAVVLIARGVGVVGVVARLDLIKYQLL